MKVMVSGGCGFIGSHLVDKLVQLGYEVVVIDNLSTGKEEFLNKKAKFYKVDIRDKTAGEIIKKEKPEVFFHLAAQINVRKSAEDPIFDIDVNINGSLNLLLNFVSIEKRKKFIFASTGGAIYGEAEILPTPETVMPFPLSPYGISKLTVEKYLHYFWKMEEMEYVSLRLGNVYGPRQNPYAEAGVIAIFTEKMLKGVNPVIFGDGNQTRDFVYVEDVVKSFILSMEKEINGVFNVGTEKETSVNEIFDYIKEFTKADVSKIFEKEKKGDIKRSCLAIGKIKKETGWKPEVSIKAGIEKTVKWFKFHYQ